MEGQLLCVILQTYSVPDASKISLGEIQKKARKRLELSNGISDKTLELLMMFREYGRSPELFIERKEKLA